MLIAFDQALNTTGYAVFNRKDGSLVAYDKFTTKSVDEEYKLREIRNKVLELIDKYRDKDDDRVVIVEVTEKGRKMKEEIIEVPEKMYCKFGKSIEDVVELKRLLDNLLATFK